jgi:hypothetical protein
VTVATVVFGFGIGAVLAFLWIRSINAGMYGVSELPPLVIDMNDPPEEGHAESEDRRAARADGRPAGDVDYQYRLREAFRRRRVHPAVETRVWSHVIAKPTVRVQVSADVTMNQKLDRDRELFSRLSVQQLEELAAESQALVDKLMAMVRANGLKAIPATTHPAPVGDGEHSDVPGPNSTDVDDG